jgi:tetratricopeptide (TPR) repeat protein
MSNNRLFGDAKASATSADVQRKQKLLQAAQERYNGNPTPENQAELASIMFEAGRYQDAEQLLTSLLSTHGDNVNVLFELGFIYKNLGRKEEAIRYFSKLVEIDPRHHLARGAENEIWRLNPEYKPSWLRK